MRKKWKGIISVVCILALIVSTIAISPVNRAEAADGYTDITLTDFGSLVEKDYTYKGDGTGGNYSGSIDKTALFLKVTYKTGKAFIGYGGTGVWKSALRIYPDGARLIFNGMGNGNDGAVAANKVFGDEVTSFLNQEFVLKIETDVFGEDVEMKFYINGTKYHTMTLTGYASKMGSYLAIGQGGGEESTVHVAPVVEEEESTKKPENLIALTLKDFGVDGIYVNGAVSMANNMLSKEGVTNLNGTMLSTNISLSEAGDRVHLFYGVTGKNSGQGLHFFLDPSKNVINFDAAGKNAKIFNGSDGGFSIKDGFDLDVSVEFVADDSDGVADDVKVGVWFNDVLYDNEYFIIKNHADNIKDSVWFQRATDKDGTTMVITNPGTDTPEQPEPVEKPENLRELTLEEFGIADGVYTSNAFKGYAGTSVATNILNTTFRQKMEFHREVGGDYYICYGAKGVAWNGIRIVPNGDGSLKLWCMSDSGNSFVLEPAKAGLDSFLDVEFELGIDLWESNDDALIDIFINGTKYNDTPYTWVNAVKDNAIGNNINLIIPSAENSFRFGTLVVENPEKLPSDFKVIGFHDFEIESGTYGFANNDLAVKGSYNDSLDRTIFSGDVTFNNPGGYMTYGGKKSAWSGIRLEPQANGNLRLYDTSDVMTRTDLSPMIAGTELVGKKFNLKISILFFENDGDGNKNDVQLGIWINDVLYNNSYIILPDYAEQMGGYLGVYCKTENTSMTIQAGMSDYGEAIIPDPSLKEISFSSFGIKDGIYGYKDNDLAASGGYYDAVKGTTLDGTLFHADVKFSSGKMMLRYGGKNSAWEGLWFQSDGNHIKLWDGENLICRFLPEIAGTQLVDNMFNLKMSIVYVDSDSDGMEDDVQLGIWFNDVMYKNAYIYLTDFALKMGSLLGIYSPKEEETLEIHSVDIYNGIDYGIFGFDKDYENYLKTTGIEKTVYTSLENVGKVKNPITGPTSPKTGESNQHIFFWLLLAAVTFTGMTVGAKSLNKRGKKSYKMCRK